MARTRLPEGVKTQVIPIRFSEAEIRMVEKAAELMGENRTHFMRLTVKERCLRVFGEFGVNVAEILAVDEVA